METLTSQSNVDDTDVLVALVFSCAIFLPFIFSCISQILFDMVLLHSFDMDLLQPAAEAFLALICCHQVIII